MYSMLEEGYRSARQENLALALSPLLKLVQLVDGLQGGHIGDVEGHQLPQIRCGDTEKG